MALFECRKKSDNYLPNVGEINYFSSSFTSDCQIGDLYVLILNGGNPTITGAEILETWDTYSASYPAKILRATSTSISVSGVTNGAYARIINIPQIKYELIDITPNTNINITTKKDDLILFPFIASSNTYSLVSNIRICFYANASNQRLAIFRPSQDGTSIFKDEHRYKLIRIYK